LIRLRCDDIVQLLFVFGFGDGVRSALVGGLVGRWPGALLGLVFVLGRAPVLETGHDGGACAQEREKQRGGRDEARDRLGDRSAEERLAD
jgi:hypothetical protein